MARRRKLMKYRPDYLQCLICQFERYIEMCHIVPVRLGGDDSPINVVPLCPNHHKLLDYGLLNNEETQKIESRIFQLIDQFVNDLRVVDWLYFLLGMRSAPEWISCSRRDIFKSLEANKRW